MGVADGSRVGFAVGSGEGGVVGAADGGSVGAGEGAKVGGSDSVGTEVGCRANWQPSMQNALLDGCAALEGRADRLGAGRDLVGQRGRAGPAVGEGELQREAAGVAGPALEDAVREEVARRRDAAQARGLAAAVRDAAVRARAQRIVKRAAVPHHVVLEAPRRQVLVERVRVGKHREDRRHGAEPPRRQILVERTSCQEHVRRILDAGNVPIVQWLVKSHSPIEHGLHGRHLRHVPATNVLVEEIGVGMVMIVTCLDRARRAEQLRHVRDLGRVPRRDVAVRRLGGRGVREPRVDGVVDGRVGQAVPPAAAPPSGGAGRRRAAAASRPAASA